MSEPQATTRKPFFSGEPFERLIGLLIAIVTIMATLTAYLESDAGAQADRTIREAQQNALQAMGIKSRGEVQTGYAWSDAYRLWLELDTLASEADQNGDLEAANRYREVRDRVAGLSPLLAPPYFAPEVDDWPNVNAFEADLYLIEATALAERFANSSNVSDAWSAKANAYVAHLTLLAVTLFLFGLSTTIVGRMRWLFMGMGTLITNVTLVWMVGTVLTSVPALPDEAMVAYARGVGLAYQDELTEAVDAFSHALANAPDYANAYYQRGNAYVELGDLDRAAADYEAAIDGGREDVNVPWNLGWTYYVLGRLEDTVSTTQTAIEITPDQIALHFNLGLAYLASSELEAAQTAYDGGTALVTQQVADARAEGEEPPASLWWYMDTAAFDLANLLNCLYDQVCVEAPPYGTIIAPDTVKTAAEELNAQLRNLTVALEYTGQPPAAAPAVVDVGDFEFAEGVHDDDGAVVAYNPLRTQGTRLRFGMVHQDEGELADISVARRGGGVSGQVFVRFDYQGLQDGQLVVVKVYSNGREVTGLRLVEQWTLGPQGQAALPLTPGSGFTLSPGDYRVEAYVDSHLVQQGGFTIE